MAKVYNPEGKLLVAWEIANWANKVHKQSGGKGNAFSRIDFLPYNGERLQGHMCDCGVDGNNISKGEFVLLPLDDETVIEGGKAYMKCKKCGAYSHL